MVKNAPCCNCTIRKSVEKSYWNRNPSKKLSESADQLGYSPPSSKELYFFVQITTAENRSRQLELLNFCFPLLVFFVFHMISLPPLNSICSVFDCNNCNNINYILSLNSWKSGPPRLALATCGPVSLFLLNF